ncbi:MAG TPA: malectin domain-containing carbohydrate-binding protein [Bryobacteraceae bacterium]|jgi:hypothetical protein|nr:malectin domain-containing carbohydrate-binding protein [Bryobacteraceae bacterium]
MHYVRTLCHLFLWIICARGQYNVLTFHGDRQRTGWISNETTLTPANVSNGSFGPIWDSPQLDSLTLNGATYPPHLYASPLYVDSVTITAGTYAGLAFHVVYAGSSNGFVYAVNASTTAGANPVAAGTILWKRQLNSPVGGLDGGIPLGILGTPIIDLTAAPSRLYVASADATQGWQVFALDITSGNILPGWPLTINNTTLAPINQNGPATWQGTTAMSQRGALNLSLDGGLLYVPFGAYGDGGAGWMVAVDTATPSLASAFAGAPSNVAFANGGMWASGGPAVDDQGRLYSTTGNGTTNTTNVPGYWGQSVLVWAPGVPLKLVGTYTPWNYCQMDLSDTDLSGGAAVVLPDLGVANTSTPHLITFGGKQGNQYLVDRDHMPGSLVTRPACSTSSATDLSLVPPGPQPQLGQAGPLNVFGPYSENFNNTDYAKARSTGAYFRAADGSNFMFVTGSSKAAVNSQQTVPPCIVKLRIVTAAGQPAYVAVEASENTFGFLSPGSPWVTSNGSANAIVWVLVANVTRSASLVGSGVPHPILYALDPVTLKALWISTPAMLNVGGKYSAPAFGHGMVFVGTDRIQAFGLGTTPPPPPPGTIAINCGGGAVGNFLADTDVVGGHSDTFTNPVDVSGVVNPAPQAVYQSKRTGNPPSSGFTYTIPGLTVGATYKVRLHFVESAVSAAGQRVFNVAINGVPVLTNFDIFKAAGGVFKAVVEEFMEKPDGSGQIAIAYTYGPSGNPLASAVEVILQTTAVRPGIAIDAGGAAAGNYVADTDFVGGHSDTFSHVIDVSAVTKPAPQAVYQSKRTGNPPNSGFTYSIPNLTTGHSYTVRLHFVESATNVAGGRKFNVAINGVTVLADFDIFAAAGAEYKAIVKQFTAAADAKGTITIAFTYGPAGNPLLSALEIIP